VAELFDTQRRRLRRLVEELVGPLVYPQTVPLEVQAHRLSGEPVAPVEISTLPFERFAIGDPWGGAWSTTWFRFSGVIPPHWAGEIVVARLELGGPPEHVGFGAEGLLWEGDRPLRGLNPRHDLVPIAGPAAGDETVELLVEAAANPYVAWGGINWPMLMPDYAGTPLYRLERAELAVRDVELERAWHDLRILAELADSPAAGERRRLEIIRTLDRVGLAVDLDDVRTSLLAQQEVWARLLDSPAPPRSHLVTAVGHAHIDSAWLWPLRETRRKCARTFSSALRLMEEEPGFVFVCSQAQQHAWMEEHYPRLFEEMRRGVADGRFEPVGSMWVEPDTNLPSGESLVRQLVYGKRFFLDRYGIETEDCWLPDAFGYSANLPQILRAAGVRFFLTQKLSWNEVDRFPHHTFWWEGIDGSRVLAHCPPTDTYNGEFKVAQLLHGAEAFAQHGLSSRSLYAFGYGDGGGGPTATMLQTYHRVRDLDPVPRVELGRAAGFFRAVESEALAAEEALAAAGSGMVPTAHSAGVGGLPVWVGELYLERHRAVQTTQASGKLGNRRSETLLREAELWLAAAGSANGAARAELEWAWRTVLLLQFHDILPGSSIHWVHEEASAAYDEVGERVGAVIGRACGELAQEVGAGSCERPILVFNAGSHDRRDLVELDSAVIDTTAARFALPADGLEAMPVQELAPGRAGFLATVQACGWARFDLVRAIPTGNPASDRAAGAVERLPPAAAERNARDEIILTNGALTVRIDNRGLLSSVWDHNAEREVVPAGARANVLQLHQDLPVDADAWDVDEGTFDRAVELTDGLESLEVLEHGPVRASARLVRSFGQSRLTQEIRLTAGSRRVEFVTEVDWAERHKFLKVAFPLAVRSQIASFEVQFGYVQRPTHANTTWDAARFEVAAQRWADLSEPGFGVALLNDCKHGYDVRGNVLRLSLLRGPTWPDPTADAGFHRFSYALLPHAGLGSATASSRPGATSVVEEAEALNMALRAVPIHPREPGAEPDTPGRRGLSPAASLVRAEGAMISSVKRADHGGDLVVRLFEPAGAHGRAEVSIGSGSGAGEIESAWRADLLERRLAEVPMDSPNRVAVRLRPFELVTLALRLAGGGPDIATG
jgi:alpha-mannosidase